MVHGKRFHALEEPTSLNTMELIPQLSEIGVVAVKIEGRQRSPAYVEQVVGVWRKALDSYRRDPHNFAVEPAWNQVLGNVDRKSTRLNSSHVRISYAVFCLK